MDPYPIGRKVELLDGGLPNFQNTVKNDLQGSGKPVTGVIDSISPSGLYMVLLDAEGDAYAKPIAFYRDNIRVLMDS
jgi:hypothetical protein